MLLICFSLLVMAISTSIDMSNHQLDDQSIQFVQCGAGTVIYEDEVFSLNDQDQKRNYILTKSGNVYRDYLKIEQLTSIYQMQVSPVNSCGVYFFGSNGVGFYTRDCGGGYQEFEYPGQAYDFKVSKVQWDWLIGFEPQNCSRTGFNKQLVLSQDGGKSWKGILECVGQAEWDKLVHLDSIPDERIVATHIQGHSQVVSYSNDFYQQHRHTLMENITLFYQTYQYFFFLRPNSEKSFQLFTGPPILHEHYAALPVQLPLDDHFYFTVIDTLDGQIMLSVQQENSNFANVYISDTTGARFALSLLNNVKSQAVCDFQKVLSLPNTYIANRYDAISAHKLKFFSLRPFELKKQTLITFDRGASWHPLKAPGQDSHCTGDCSLHLKGRSDYTNPIYSHLSAPGVILAIGNIGRNLEANITLLNTYLSRDGGRNWTEVRKGSSTFEITDKGRLLAVAADTKKTDSIRVSLDSGGSWQEIKIFKEEKLVVSIETDPQAYPYLTHLIRGHRSQVFYVFCEDGAVAELDFSQMYSLICQEDDYTQWEPEGKCVLGKKQVFTMRKKERKCADERSDERQEKICECTEHDWECDLGYVKKKNEDLCVPISARLSFNVTQRDERPSNCSHGMSYRKMTGFRKVVGTLCQHGVDLSVKEIPCYEEDLVETQALSVKFNFYTIILVAIALLLVILVVLGRRRIAQFLVKKSLGEAQHEIQMNERGEKYESVDDLQLEEM